MLYRQLAVIKNKFVLLYDVSEGIRFLLCTHVSGLGVRLNFTDINKRHSRLVAALD